MDEYILAILVPEVPFLNAGKMAAQCAHAANHFMACYYVRNTVLNLKEFTEWVSSTDQSFGTTHVYSVTDAEFYKFFFEIKNLYMHGIIVDPTYPYWNVKNPPPKDEIENFLKPVTTCGWAFIPRDAINKYKFKFYI